MMASLVATYGVIAALTGALVVLVAVSRYLRSLVRRGLPASAGAPWPLDPSARFCPDGSAARRRHGCRAERHGMATGHGAECAPGSAGRLPEEPVSARILPFVRQPARRPPPHRGEPPPDAA